MYSHTGLTGYFEAVIGLVSLKEPINIYRRNNRKSMNQIRDGLNFYISWNQTAENFVLQVKRHSVPPPPPECRVGLGDFAISSLPVGLGFFKNQGGVAIVGWGRFF